ncbi:unnamed protein product [Allacma fusca]|uniref:Uncharacterized protein n=1 Tax=Allacma fusca TaxID=39272 RepID=A0A8J2K666_9HEXA|nr:unnamed protein product [Allacma fusca]
MNVTTSDLLLIAVVSVAWLILSHSSLTSIDSCVPLLGLGRRLMNFLARVSQNFSLDRVTLSRKHLI